jgi:hypothetical protein
MWRGMLLDCEALTRRGSGRELSCLGRSVASRGQVWTEAARCWGRDEEGERAHLNSCYSLSPPQRS